MTFLSIFLCFSSITINDIRSSANRVWFSIQILRQINTYNIFGHNLMSWFNACRKPNMKHSHIDNINHDLTRIEFDQTRKFGM